MQLHGHGPVTHCQLWQASSVRARAPVLTRQRAQRLGHVQPPPRGRLARQGWRWVPVLHQVALYLEVGEVGACGQWAQKKGVSGPPTHPPTSGTAGQQDAALQQQAVGGGRGNGASSAAPPHSHGGYADTAAPPPPQPAQAHAEKSSSTRAGTHASVVMLMLLLHAAALQLKASPPPSHVPFWLTTHPWPGPWP